jgi:hypothetical protein
MIGRCFGAPSESAYFSSDVYAPHGLGAPSLAMGGAESGTERLYK